MTSRDGSPSRRIPDLGTRCLPSNSRPLTRTKAFTASKRFDAGRSLYLWALPEVPCSTRSYHWISTCSVSAASGRSSSSLGDSRKRPRAQDDAGGSGEDLEEDSAAIIATTLATLDKPQQASPRA